MHASSGIYKRSFVVGGRTGTPYTAPPLVVLTLDAKSLLWVWGVVYSSCDVNRIRTFRVCVYVTISTHLIFIYISLNRDLDVVCTIHRLRGSRNCEVY